MVADSIKVIVFLAAFAIINGQDLRGQSLRLDGRSGNVGRQPTSSQLPLVRQQQPNLSMPRSRVLPTGIREGQVVSRLDRLSRPQTFAKEKDQISLKELQELQDKRQRQQGTQQQRREQNVQQQQLELLQQQSQQNLRFNQNFGINRQNQRSQSNTPFFSSRTSSIQQQRNQRQQLPSTREMPKFDTESQRNNQMRSSATRSQQFPRGVFPDSSDSITGRGAKLSEPHQLSGFLEQQQVLQQRQKEEHLRQQEQQALQRQKEEQILRQREQQVLQRQKEEHSQRQREQQVLQQQKGEHILRQQKIEKDQEELIIMQRKQQEELAKQVSLLQQRQQELEQQLRQQHLNVQNKQKTSDSLNLQKPTITEISSQPADVNTSSTNDVVVDQAQVKRDRIHQLADLLGYKPTDLLNAVIELEASKYPSVNLLSVQSQREIFAPATGTQAAAAQTVTSLPIIQSKTLPTATAGTHKVEAGASNAMNVQILPKGRDLWVRTGTTSSLTNAHTAVTLPGSSTGPIIAKETHISGLITNNSKIKDNIVNEAKTSSTITPVVTYNLTTSTASPSMESTPAEIVVTLSRDNSVQENTTHAPTGTQPEGPIIAKETHISGLITNNSKIKDNIVNEAKTSSTITPVVTYNLTTSTASPSMESTPAEIVVTLSRDNSVQENTTHAPTGTQPEVSAPVISHGQTGAGAVTATTNAAEQMALLHLVSAAQNVIQVLKNQMTELHRDGTFITASKALLTEIQSLIGASYVTYNNVILNNATTARRLDTTMFVPLEAMAQNSTAENGTRLALMDLVYNGTDSMISGMNYTMTTDSLNTTTTAPVTEPTEAVPTIPPPPPGFPHMFEPLPGQELTEAQLEYNELRESLMAR